MSSIEERFWAKVEKTETCWNWTASLRGRGYGQCSLGGGRQGYAHRFSYELARGPIADGFVIDHACHNKRCVNPEHLRAVSQKQNMENQVGAYVNSTSGVRGVSWSKRLNKWVAQVRHHGETIYLGLYSTVAAANDVVLAKRLELFTHNDLDRTATK